MTTYKEKFNRKYGFKEDKSHSLQDISKLTGYKLPGLKVIYEKGKGAYYSNPRSVRPQVKSADQWAKARVYASVSKGSKTYNIDKSHLKK